MFGATEARPLLDSDRTLFATGTAQVIERWLTGMPGRRLFHSARAPYRDKQGKVIGVIGISRDITDVRLAQQALRDSKAMLEMAGRVAKVGGWTQDTASGRVYWSDVMADLHDEPAGFSPPVNLSLDTFVAEYRTVVRDAYERCVATGTAFDLEVEKTSSSGRRFWARTMGEAVRDADGRVVRVQGALQDITERRLARQETQKLASRLSNTLESITDAFFTVDRDWRFTYVNRETERLWGRPRDTLLGRALWEVYPLALGTVFEHQ
ncbi:MAG: PAS domain-containing protein, partial [Caldilinea sp.]|nr:PAS domain-containing protein [Caldilinea sp.]